MVIFRLPVTKYSNPGSEKSRRRRSIDDELNFDDDFYNDTIALNTSNLEFDPSVDLPQSIYCDVINLLDEDCWESNVVEIWNYNSSVIESLTKENIIDVINTKSIRYFSLRTFTFEHCCHSVFTSSVPFSEDQSITQPNSEA